MNELMECIEGYRRKWYEDWKGTELNLRSFNDMENHGKSWKIMENH